MSKSWYTIDLGKSPLKKGCFQRQIAWPVYAWKAILPSIYTDQLDILQRLILSLAKIGQLKDPSLLYQLGLSKELVQSVKKSCLEKGYLDKETHLTESGTRILQGGGSIDQDMLTNLEHVYIFRDALTGDIIPNFQVKELPRGEQKAYDYIFDGHLNLRDKKPTFLDIGQAFKVRELLNRYTETYQTDYAAIDSGVEAISPIGHFEFMVEDVDWQLLNDEGEIEVNTLEEKEQAEARKADAGNSTIKIVSTKSELLYLEANLYVDSDLPETVTVTSPFGQQEDEWFTRHLFMHSQKNSRIKEIIDYSLEEAKDELKDRYPFNNHLNIQLLNKYPFIANYEKWQPLRTQIEATSRAYNRLVDGDEDFDTFYIRAQRTLEGVLKYCIEQIPHKPDVLEPVSKLGFIDTIKRIAEELRIDIPSNYHSVDFYNRLKLVAQNRGMASKDRALFLSFDAYFNKEDTPSLVLLRNVPDFYHRVNLITNIRNRSAHFTEEAVEPQHFEEIKQELDFLLDSLIAQYLQLRS